MKDRKRRWNNYLILAVILFIVILNLPTIIKDYLLPHEESNNPSLLNPQLTITSIQTLPWSLERESNGDWKSTVSFDISALELVQRWRGIVGTLVDDKTYQSLAGKLNNPRTVEVWYEEQEEPQRITYYRFPQFWLLKNWQEEWIAVTAEDSYLFPPVLSETPTQEEH
ncbi:hypothetical protein [Vibrio mangrovi]|uniref:50S ribosomal protein L33 n=1 Tax=Vibrio mangrovi TaxID=474394 RepID=A0A1Y6IYJ1_9VIBR|nr:hypothetical protein [Vibrio mangrovi]MDW6002217.1 hypothetical protein [Vibrio mangrovi]SMS01562.1 hypothetical protein VIM7927_02858 [Vibrio mangrovi]